MNGRGTKEDEGRKESRPRDRGRIVHDFAEGRDICQPNGEKCSQHRKGKAGVNRIRYRNAVLDDADHVRGEGLGRTNNASQASRGPIPCRLRFQRKDNRQQAQAACQSDAVWSWGSGGLT